MRRSAGDDRTETIGRAAALIDAAVDQGARIVLLPELFAVPFVQPEPDPDYFRLAESLDGPSNTMAAKASRRAGITVVSSVFEAGDVPGVYYNTACTYVRGELKSVYRKSHLPFSNGFPEKFYFRPGGAEPEVVDTGETGVGTVICYERHFPELSRIVALRGGSVLCVPVASASAPMREVFQLELRAHAVLCLDVTIQQGGVNIVPQQVLSAGNAEFAVSHVTKTMVTREQGADLVNIGQVFQRGAYLQVAWADSGIKELADLKGKRVGSWGYGNELVQYAAMRGAGVEPGKDAKIIQQPFDMSLLLKREVDAAQAKTYNEYAQLLETKNPKTGKLYQPSDFTAINLQDEGYQSLEDGIYAKGDWLAKKENQETAVKFLKATYRGWGFCRDDLDGCVDLVLENGSALGKGHQTWMLNEVNKLIGPSKGGVGTLDKAAWDQTIDIATEAGVLKKDPGKGAYRTDLTERAVKELKADDFDTTGDSYQPEKVTITPGGK